MSSHSHRVRRGGRWALALAVLVAVPVGVLAAASVPSGAASLPTAGLAYQLQVAKSGLCIDVPGASTSNGALLQQWGCTPSAAWQQFRLTAVGTNYQLVNVNSGKCIDVTNWSTTSGTHLQQYGCVSSQTNQLWTLTASGTNTFQVISVFSGLCISDQGASTTSGAPIIQETCTANTNKQWAFNAVNVCSARSYGATGSGTTNDTAALQAAINACAGGGTAELTAGRYLSTPLNLPSNIRLQIDTGATLLASQNASDYPASGSHLAPLLLANNASNVTITGGGTIDGQGAPWWALINQEKAAGQPLSPRPALIDLETVATASITGITVKNAPNVHITMKKVSNVTVDRITISSPSNSPNTDGIDVWSSSNVSITNSAISDGDDNLAINSSAANGPAHDISLSGCTIGTGHGLSIGSFTAGGVYNVSIHDNTLNGTSNGIRIKTARDRGGEVHALSYANMTMTAVSTPISILAYYPSVPADGDPAQAITANTPNYHDITISNVTATGASSAAQIVGVPELPITALHLNSVNITASTGGVVRNATVTTSSTTIRPSSGSAWILQSNGRVS